MFSMTQSASQSASFVKDVAKNLKVFTVRDEAGVPAPMNGEGKRAMPFWSTLSRVQTIIQSVPAYHGFEAVELSWESFRDSWLPGLKRDGILVGMNWTGPKATGYDFEPEEVIRRIEFEIG